MEATPDEKKAALKALRRTRRQWIKNASAAVREQKNALKSIRSRLEAGAATIPEIAAATALPAHEVLWFVAALKKYGEIVEDEKDGAYYRYALKAAVSQPES